MIWPCSLAELSLLDYFASQCIKLWNTLANEINSLANEINSLDSSKMNCPNSSDFTYSRTAQNSPNSNEKTEHFIFSERTANRLYTSITEQFAFSEQAEHFILSEQIDICPCQQQSLDTVQRRRRLQVVINNSPSRFTCSHIRCGAVYSYRSHMTHSSAF